MSSNVLIPGAVVVVCLLIIFAISLGDREKPQPKVFQLRVPQKKRRNQSDDLPDEQKHDSNPNKETLAQWHEKHESDLLHFFEILDSLIFKGIEVDENEINTEAEGEVSGYNEKILKFETLKRVHSLNV